MWWNIILARTYFSAFAKKNFSEAVTIDGANDLQILFKSHASISETNYVRIVFICLCWAMNSYFDAMIYIKDPDFTAKLQLRIKKYFDPKPTFTRHGGSQYCHAAEMKQIA